MYFNAETQGNILNRFHFALKDTGFLFLGKAEMLLTRGNLFTPVHLQHRIFNRVSRINECDRILAMSLTNGEKGNNRLSRDLRMRELSFERIPIAQLVVDFSGNLVQVNAIAREMFAINLNDVGKPLQDLEISYRPLELRSPIEQVYRDRMPIKISDVVHNLSNGKIQYLDIHIEPLQEDNDILLGVGITIIDVSRYHELQAELHRSNQELETINEEMQSNNEELETTNEELQSTNEELETTNEELQSTNEELETMNEELQSTNEELQTINDELRQRTNELNHTNAFLHSILASLKSAVVVIDRQFNILSWNNEAENLWGLRKEEVEEQTFFNLDIGLPIDQLREPIRNCLAENDNHPEIVVSAINRRGQSLECRVSFNPLVDSQKKRLGLSSPRFEKWGF